MRIIDKHHVGLVRPLPRWSEATQRRSLAEAGIERAIVLGERDDAAVLADIRAGDVVHVYLLHLLAERDIVGIHARTSLFWWLRHLVARGAVIVETGTDRRADTADLADIPALLDMAAEAIETITRGTRGRAAAKRARDAGAKGGRPAFDPTRNRDAVEAIHYAPPDKRLTGAAYRKALRRLGWSRANAYKHLQGRDGRLAGYPQTKERIAMMSNGAWAVLKQLKQGGVWDGDVIDKAGRTELINKGLARRDRKFDAGPYAGCQINELTEDGAKLALVCIELDRKYGAAN